MKRTNYLKAILLALAIGGLSAVNSSGASNSESKSSLDATRKAQVLTDVLRKFGSGEKIDPAEWQDFVRAQNDGMTTGPAIGERVPEFALPDHNGKQWTLHDLMGPSGLLLVFTRSADW